MAIRTMQDENSILSNADAVFEDWREGNYQLAQDSPARFVGDAGLAPSFDLAGTPRGEITDIGALQFFVRTPGDFDFSGAVDADDIDLLFAQIRTGASEPRFDLNNDLLVDRSDADVLIRNILGTDYGDTDLDGDVDAADRTQLAGGWTGALSPGNESSWTFGDFDGDGDVDSVDQTFLIGNWTGAQQFAASTTKRTSKWIA